ncbi:hypothetical protein IFM89_008005 [Coptis chinensis]|uniref:TRF2/HOY1 PH-like domain-containing protein n=1 Tax=Coptis chinensis TaxID=261450 RepID=A0A835HRQ5_9MAGN|nr:hypothetical protein IFM89_008005 [Coptis chinensis]
MIQEESYGGCIVWKNRDSDHGGFSTCHQDLQDSFIRMDNNNGMTKRDAFPFHGLVSDSKRVKRRGLHENHYHHQDGGLLSVSTESSPIGLKLTKTPSFIDLLEAALSLEETKTSFEKTSSEKRRKKDADEKYKAVNFNAKLLRIGSWERHAKRELDLVAKCYYQKRKLVWEMLDNGLKSKIEIQWSDITAIRAAFSKDNNDVLEIELKNVPLFMRETNPQPRKHTNWQASADFTGGQATRYRRHYLQFQEGTLQPHYEKILQCDKDLRKLSLQPFPVNRSHYFQLNMSGNQDYTIDFNRPQPELPSIIQFPQYAGIQGPAYVPFLQAQMFVPTPRPSVTYSDLASPLSVMEFPRMENHGGNQDIEHPRTLCMGATINSQNIYEAKSTNQVLQNHYSYPLRVGNGLERPPSSNTLLKEIHDHLLGDSMPSTFSDEQKVKARVNSMSNLRQFAQEQTHTCFDEQKLMTKVNSFCNLLQLSQEQAAINNNGTSDTEYSQSTNNTTSSWSSGESNGHGAVLSKETVNVLPVKEHIENRLLCHQRNSSFSELFLDQALEKWEKLADHGGSDKGMNM